MRARGTLLLAVPLALIASGCASHHHDAAGGQPTPAGTTIRTFHAYDSSGQLAGTVGDVASGSCWTTSIAAPVAGAYRCIAADKILDPCFAPTHPQTPPQVACFATPWSRALVLQLTAALPAATATGTVDRSWAFRLANGVRCVASTGTVPAVHGENLGYHCTDGHDAALRDTAAATVTADYGDARTQTVRSVTVTTIWRG